MRGDEINTKSRVADGGFTLAWMAVPTVGKRVFLRAVSTIPTVMRCMTPSPATVKKAAYGRSKSPAFAGTKTAANRGPSPNPPKGREFLLAVFEVVVWRSFPLGKVRMGLVWRSFPLEKAGMGLWMGLWMGLLCQCLGVDVVEHQTTDGEAEDGGDVDH